MRLIRPGSISRWPSSKMWNRLVGLVWVRVRVRMRVRVRVSVRLRCRVTKELGHGL